jgi:hypothetical protein
VPRLPAFANGWSSRCLAGYDHSADCPPQCGFPHYLFLNSLLKALTLNVHAAIFTSEAWKIVPKYSLSRPLKCAILCQRFWCSVWHSCHSESKGDIHPTGPTLALKFNEEDHQLIQDIRTNGKTNRPEDADDTLSAFYGIGHQEALPRLCFVGEAGAILIADGRLYGRQQRQSAPLRPLRSGDFIFERG